MPRLRLRRRWRRATSPHDAVQCRRRRAPALRVRGAAGQAELGDLARLGAHLGPDHSRHLPVEPARRRPPPADSFCALSGKPTDDDGGGGFTVVMVEPPGSCFIFFCHVGSSSSSPAAWVRHEYDIGTRKMDIEGRQRMKRSIHCITSCGGKLYHFIRSTAYGVLEFSPEPVFTTVRMKPASPFTTTDMFVASIFSVDVDGKLHLVFIFESGGGVVADVAVYRVDLEKRKHVRIGSIGDRAILVGGRRNDMGAAGWCRARRHGLLPNSIYWMNPGDRRLRVYELGKRTEEVRDPFKGVAESADGTWCRPYWMIPART